MLASPRIPVVPRSPEWPRVARAHLVAQPQCICCGPLWREATPVQVHHIFPVHYLRATGRNDLELDERNLATLCTNLAALPGPDHHLLVGHLHDFECANPSTRIDAQRFIGQTATQLRASSSWCSTVASRVPPLATMSELQRRGLRALMDRVMPMR